jgi:hypothetical protein
MDVVLRGWSAAEASGERMWASEVAFLGAARRFVTYHNYV